ncbi:cysteine desulfurase IscS [Muricauda sp. NBRC 101325]|nr:cysteine desulfurase IscS [Muricauda sp. NBRC 101325]
MKPFFCDYFGNASSNHAFGQKANQQIQYAREQVAALINASSDEIIFTSGSTEAINLGIKGFVESNSQNGNHIITVSTEHKAVLASCEYLETKGYEVTYLDVDKNGQIDIKSFENAIKDNTILVVVMYVNNEIGVIQPINEIGRITHEREIAFLCDATQAIGKVEINVEDDRIDMLSFSGHKFNGPKGIGVLYKKKGVELTPQIHGGTQENGMRAGTYNTPLIVGLGKACEIILHEYNTVHKHITELTNYFEASIAGIGKLIVPNTKNHFPGIMTVEVPGLPSDIFVANNGMVTVANGSACQDEIITESHVIRSLDKDKKWTNNTIRISFDRFTTKEEIDHLVSAISSFLHLDKV